MSNGWHVCNYMSSGMALEVVDNLRGCRQPPVDTSRATNDDKVDIIIIVIFQC